MTLAEYREEAKLSLDILFSDITFDTRIESFVGRAVRRLPPYAYREVPRQSSSVTPDSFGEVEISLSDLSTALDDVRKVEASDGTSKWPAKRHQTHGTTLTVRELSSDVTTIILYGLKKFTVTEVPTELDNVIVWFTMGEFYAFLAGNARQYNVYMQNGRQETDNMADLADYWDNKAKQELIEKGQLYGR